MHLKLFCVLFFAASACAQISPNFASKVLVQAVSQSTKGNVIVSPYSLLAPLGTLSLASKNSTRREILDVLGVETKTELVKAYKEYKEKLKYLENLELVTANKIFISDNYKINHRFHTLVKKFFGVEVQNVDFSDASATKSEITQWIKNKTQNNILYWNLKPTPLYRAAIVNAIYLNASWAERFKLKGRKDFYIDENSTVQVHYMDKILTARHTYTEDLHAEVFQIPYKDNECSFVGVVPYVMNSIEGVLDSLANDGNVINKVLETQMTFKNINLTMPVFDVFSTTNLRQLLQNLGVHKLFKDAKLYRLIVGEKSIYVNEANQKIVMSVNQHGTQASSGIVSGVERTLLSYVVPEVDVLVDKPFYFEVRCSDIILINGVIRNPMTVFKYDKLFL